jgi:predicted RNA-binding protein YlqC (UPF0109 family)
MESFISFVVKHLVANPDSVTVELGTDDKGREVFRLHVAHEDLGQVIGKEGKTANAIRTLVIAAAAKQGRRAGFEIVDPQRDRTRGGAAPV